MESPKNLKPQPGQTSAISLGEQAILNKCSMFREGGICLLSRLLVTPVSHSSCPVYFPLNSGAAKTNHGHLTGPRDMAMWAAGPDSACSGTAWEDPEGSNARCQGAVCKSRADLAKEHGKHSAHPVKGDVCLRVSWLWFCLAEQFKASMKEKVKAFWSTKPCRHS